MFLKESELETLDIPLVPGDTVFLVGDLGAGKTTLARSIIRRLTGPETIVRSPTYAYFSKYGENLYHFDLYRIEDYETFVNIGAEEIFENPDAIRLVEWPDRLEGRWKPTITVTLEKVEGDETLRRVNVTRIYP